MNYSKASIIENVDELNSVVNEEISLHSKLKELLSRKLDLIQNKQIEKLDALVSQEEKLIFDIDKAEDRRQRIVNEIAKHLKLHENIKAIELCEKLPEPHSINLMMKFVRLMELINDITILNIGIKNMLEFENMYMELTIRLLSGKLKKDTFYNNNGKHKEEDTTPSFLDGRA